MRSKQKKGVEFFTDRESWQLGYEKFPHNTTGHWMSARLTEQFSHSAIDLKKCFSRPEFFKLVYLTQLTQSQALLNVIYIESIGMNLNFELSLRVHGKPNTHNTNYKLFLHIQKRF